MAEEVVKTVENVDSLFESIIINGEEHVSESYVAPVTTKSVSTTQTVQTTVEQEETEESEPSTVEKVVPNIDINFLQIIVNGEEHTSENYVAPVTTKKTVVKSSSATSTPTSSESSSTRQITGDDVYAVLLNDVLHNFVDRAVTESLAEEVQERERIDGILGEHITDLQSDVTNLGTDVGNIEALIPSQATDENQLADKDFVNSSIATNTANFLGTYTSLADITAIPNPTNNDYAFLQTVDTAGNTIYQRYKYNAQTSSWLFEYELNNSGFTAEQWATINSGLTQSLVNTAITNAVNALDVASSGGSGKYIESISEVDGKISAVEASIADTVTSGNVHSVSSDAVASAISNAVANTLVSAGESNIVSGNSQDLSMPTTAYNNMQLYLLVGCNNSSNLWLVQFALHSGTLKSSLSLGASGVAITTPSTYTVRIAYSGGGTLRYRIFRILPK